MTYPFESPRLPAKKSVPQRLFRVESLKAASLPASGSSGSQENIFLPRLFGRGPGFSRFSRPIFERVSEALSPSSVGSRALFIGLLFFLAFAVAGAPRASGQSGPAGDSVRPRRSEIDSLDRKRSRAEQLFPLRASGLGIFQSASGSSERGSFVTGELGLSPRRDVGGGFVVGADFSGFPLRLGAAREWVLGYSLAAVGGAPLGRSATFELGVGRQDWGNYTRAGWQYSAAFHLDLKVPPIAGLVLGASYYDRPSFPYVPAVLVRLGLEFHLTGRKRGIQPLERKGRR
jgi:hypothetical protein